MGSGGPGDDVAGNSNTHRNFSFQPVELLVHTYICILRSLAHLKTQVHRHGFSLGLVLGVQLPPEGGVPPHVEGHGDVAGLHLGRNHQARKRRVRARMQACVETAKSQPVP